MKCLAQAHECGFSQTALLREASEHFLASIRHHYRNPEPYLGMAYLLMLTENYVQAMKYVFEALRIDPSHQGALSLQAAIRDQAETPAAETPSDEDEAEIQYDRLEDLLEREIRLISALPSDPVTEAEALLSLRRRFAELQRTHAQLSARCGSLAENLDALGLHARLRTFERRLERIARSLQLSEQMLSLREQMNAEYEAAAFLCRHLYFQTPSQAYLQLESTLDACDRLADQIDLLEERGNDISMLKADYRRLTGMVKLLQETIDEMKA